MIIREWFLYDCYMREKDEEEITRYFGRLMKVDVKRIPGFNNNKNNGG